MRIRHHLSALSLVLLAGCVGEELLFEPAFDLRSDPSVLVAQPGQVNWVTVSAYKENEPVSVHWSVGRTGNGVFVVEDSSYGQVFVGNRLMLPAKSHVRRYRVILTDTLSTDFVIGGGAGYVTIPVNLEIP